MRWLTDENLDQRIVEWLPRSGQDVVRVVDLAAGVEDSDLLTISVRDARYVMTDDKDFGELLIRRQLIAPGAVLLRFYGQPMANRIARLEEWWSEIESLLPGRLVVVSMGQLRSRPFLNQGT